MFSGEHVILLWDYVEATNELLQRKRESDAVKHLSDEAIFCVKRLSIGIMRMIENTFTFNEHMRVANFIPSPKTKHLERNKDLKE
jgi:hypothetical protein